MTLVDYGASNLLNVQRAFEYLDTDVKIANTPEQIWAAERIVFPGVGSFPHAINQLSTLGLFDALKAVAANKPFLGICLGMQMMLDYSNELQKTQGLSLISGKVDLIPSKAQNGSPIIVPHTGWSNLNFCQEHKITRGLTPDDAFYFVHSYQAILQNTEQQFATCSYSDYSINAIIAQDNLVGCQFHPEKSGKLGLKVLTNFLSI